MKGSSAQVRLWPGRRHGQEAVLILGAILAVLTFLFIFDPAGTGLYPPCPFHLITGLHCPGCGSLRALHQLLHGNLVGALGLNPLAVIILPVLLYSLVSTAIRVLNNKPPARPVVSATRIWLLLAGIIAFWVLRNIPVYPLDLLAP